MRLVVGLIRLAVSSVHLAALRWRNRRMRRLIAERERRLARW